MYHDSHGVFPPAVLNPGSMTDAPGKGAGPGILNHTGFAFLLPYLEQRGLYEQFDFRYCSTNATYTGYGAVNYTTIGSTSVNGPAVATRLGVLECPSSPTIGQKRTDTSGSYAGTPPQGVYRTNWFFSSGAFRDYSPPFQQCGSDVRRGMFGNNGSARIADVRDGTSSSFALGEGVGDDAGKIRGSAYGPWGLAGLFTCCHGVVDSNSATSISYTWSTAYMFRLNATDYYNGGTHVMTAWAWVFNSAHPGGVNFVFGDGSVRFLRETIDYTTYCQLAYIQDGQIPTGAEF